MGPIMLDVEGTSLNAEDKELLTHPLVGGLILFTRNYNSPQQVAQLTQEIKAVAGQNILLAVDHEGGRVQRFREKFSAIPAMGMLWELANKEIKKASELAQYAGQLMALEVSSVGIDISFSPVVDLNGISKVIGDRAFHHDPIIVKTLATAFIQGMHSIGMKATAKHFPGHGSVEADSHVALPIDKRSKEAILDQDIKPFKQLIDSKLIDALMPAHVIYPEFDDKSVGFSHFWLQQVLRQQLAFDGVIFSDDLTMEGAASIGGYIERAEAAQQAGCDMLLVCNNRNAVINIIDKANINVDITSTRRLSHMLMQTKISYSQLPQLAKWQIARQALGINTK